MPAPLFKKGQSGNPGGRPKSKLASLLASYLRAKDPETRQSREKTLIKKLYALAVSGKGDLAAMQEIFNRLLGKPQASVDVSSNGPVPLMLVLGDEKGGEKDEAASLPKSGDQSQRS